MSTYSVANALHRNIYTEIQTFSWSGIGPDLAFNLYHNSAAVSAESPLKQGFGPGDEYVCPTELDEIACATHHRYFSKGMGPGWSTSYSAHLICDDGVLGPACTKLRAVADDGTENVYTRDGDSWQPPTGVFDRLIENAIGFRLLHRDQSADEFDTQGRLLRVVDPTSQALDVRRHDASDPTTPLDVNEVWIVDAAGRKLVLTSDGNGYLASIKDDPVLERPAENEPRPIGERYWYLRYSSTRLAYGSNTLSRIVQKLASSSERWIAFSHDNRGRISTISDKYLNGTETPHTYSYLYAPDTNAVEIVVDPMPAALTQRFATGCGEDNFVATTYTDRRGNDWAYESTWDPTAASTDPAAVQSEIHAVENPLGERTEYGFTGRLMTRRTDASGNTWKYKYTESGNLEATSIPSEEDRIPGIGGFVLSWEGKEFQLGEREMWFYDSYNNNLRIYSDRGGGYRFYFYELAEFPTLVTLIEGGKVLAGPNESLYRIARFEYYTAATDPPWKRGLLKRVTDPNGVVTFYDYDRFGQPSVVAEGSIHPSSDPACDAYVYRLDLTHDARSRLISNQWSCANESACGGGVAAAGGGGGSANYNAADEVTGGTCTDGIGAVAAVDAPPVAPNGSPPIPAAVVFPVRTELLTPVPGTSAAITYTGRGLLKTIGRVIAVDHDRVLPLDEDRQRDRFLSYDELGMLGTDMVDTTEGGWRMQSAHYVADRSAGTFTRTGRDEIETVTEFDDVGRIARVSRAREDWSTGDAHDPITAVYSYYPNGQTETVTFGNGASTLYRYDAAGRVTVIEHRDALGRRILTLNYSYDRRGQPVRIEEQDVSGASSQHTMSYDGHHRLIAEHRDGYYDLSYQYDRGGNRTRRVDAIAYQETVYTYDISNPDQYGSANNRLMYYETKSLGHPTIPDGTVLSRTWNYYNCSGSITRVVTNQASSPTTYAAMRLEYGADDQTVEYSVRESWSWDGSPAHSPTDYSFSDAREYRYDSGRARYRQRLLDLDALNEGRLAAVQIRWTDSGGEIVDGVADIWTDYDGDRAYGEFMRDSVNAPVPLSEYEPGIARSVETHWAPGELEYEHRDQIGSLRIGTDASGAPTSARIYTAFGEPVTHTRDNYGYCSVWGYQSGATDLADSTAFPDLPFLHVGARYYDPASGRFVQRDPIGINGGLNVYAYVENSPMTGVDPSGLQVDDRVDPPLGPYVGGAAASGAAGGALVGGGAVPGAAVGATSGLAAWGGICIYNRLADIVKNLSTLLSNRAEDAKKREEHPDLFPPPPPPPPSRPLLLSCFVAGTPVAMADGTQKAIETVVVGDRVLSFDTELGRTVVSRVSETFAHENPTESIVVVNGTIRATRSHPFYANGQWVPAGELRVGDTLLGVQTDGGTEMLASPTSVTSLSSTGPAHTVYNLEVDTYHNYFVDGVLVHNKMG